MDETEKKIKDILSQRLDTPDHYTKAIKNVFYKNNNHKSYKFLKVAAIICLCLTLTGGIVFATKDYLKGFLYNYFGLGKEIDIATQNGYIENTDMEYIPSDVAVDGEKYVIRAKITDFLMDDMNLSVHFDFEFADNLNETINLNELNNVELIDLIVTDEKNRIIFNNNRNSFENFCEENNLQYEFKEFNENYMNNGFNNFIALKNENRIVFTYNMYTYDKYPKSQELNFHFKQIKLQATQTSNDKQNTIILDGNWDISVDVPKQMYDRKSISYKVISCSDSNFDITTATLYDTRFEFGAVISNIKKPDENKLKNLEPLLGTETSDVIENHDRQLLELLEEWRPIQESYLVNERGQRFDVSDSPSKRENGNFVENNKFDYYTTFELTKYQATDKLTVTILFKDTPVIIELQKM